MRLKRTNLILALCLFIWILITYFVFTNQTFTKESNGNSIQKDIEYLEKNIREQFDYNNRLISQIRKYLNRQEFERDSEKYKFEEADAKLPILVLACNRDGITKCLNTLIKYRPDPDKFPIIVSQDCSHEPTTDAILSFGSQVSLIKQPDQSEINVPQNEKKFKGYFKIARHYGWALNQMFFNFNFSKVIIVEDDLEIAPDFYDYFLGTYPILKKDPTLWCVSAWNDNGKTSLVNLDRPDLLYRTDFFPGLGWMLTKSIWLELYKKWPKAYWDDWIRNPNQRRGRACIRPEVSRTRTFGKVGVSNGLFYEKHLKYIKLNEQHVPFTQKNLTYLMKNAYDSEFIKNVYQSIVVSYQELLAGHIAHDGPVRIVYRTQQDFKTISKNLGLMSDFKSGVPRTAYKGIVTFHYKGRMVHLAPNLNWKGYDPHWS